MFADSGNENVPLLVAAREIVFQEKQKFLDPKRIGCGVEALLRENPI